VTGFVRTTGLEGRPDKQTFQTFLYRSSSSLLYCLKIHPRILWRPSILLNQLNPMFFRHIVKSWLFVMVSYRFQFCIYPRCWIHSPDDVLPSILQLISSMRVRGDHTLHTRMPRACHHRHLREARRSLGLHSRRGCARMRCYQAALLANIKREKYLLLGMPPLARKFP
jgi:hypothetical protein